VFHRFRPLNDAYSEAVTGLGLPTKPPKQDGIVLTSELAANTLHAAAGAVAS
jgi:hypothetical protein